MTPMLDKQRVRQRFRKALATYNSQAQIQERMADLLLQIVRQKVGSEFGRVLEIGAGTGLLTAKIRHQLKIDTFAANDLVDEAAPFVAAAFPGARCIPGDAETCDQLPGQLDLIMSNATFQWMTDSRGFLRKLRGLLRPGAHLVFSSFGPDNFKEISRLVQPGLAYPGFSELHDLCAEEYRIVYCQEENVTLHFPDIFSVMRHMQSLGVNGIRPHRWTRAAWRDLAGRYHETFGTRRGLPLTYHPFYFALQAQ